uniref:Chromosome partition protein Smc n=1 Tax=Zeugodacus cucurbitae TaxID=28588 RepID=A0A0A1XNA5_ZEUCU
MNSLILMNYLDQQAKGNGKLQNLLAQTAQCLMRKEEQCKLEKELLQESLIHTMDVYELETIMKQLKLQYQQQCASQEQMLTVYKHSVEFCVQVQNIDWNSQLDCKLELLQLRCQNEMRELSEEYEEEKERRKMLEQRPIVQTARAAEKEIANIQAKIENVKERASAYQNQLFEQLEKLQNERNAAIVFLIKGSKEIADKEAELAALESANNAQTNDLIKQKEEIISKMQKLGTKLPVFTNANKLEPCPEQINANNDFSSTIATKLDVFPKLGNTTNANTEVKPKEMSFLELFKEWELKKHQQFQQLVNITPYTDYNPTVNVPDITVNISETDNTSTIHDITPKSILRRPSISEEDGGVVVPKKRVRFATPDGVDSDSDLDFNTSSHTSFNAVEGNAADGRGDEIQNTTFVVEENMPPFNGDTETIEIFSTDEVVASEIDKEDSEHKFKKPDFVTAKKLLRKAKLQGSQRQSKVQDIAGTVGKRPKIEIQECRVIKPAGTKLPTKLPIALTPEPQEQATSNSTIQPKETLQATNNKVFKSPPKPKMRKQQQIPDYNNFFADFSKESSVETSQTDSEAGVNTVKDTNDMLSFDEPMKSYDKAKRKGKKNGTMDFESFFRETLKNCEIDDSGASMQVSPIEGENELLQFDLNFDDNNGLSHSNYDDLFADQVNGGKVDDDMLSFNFSD